MCRPNGVREAFLGARRVTFRSFDSVLALSVSGAPPDFRTLHISAAKNVTEGQVDRRAHSTRSCRTDIRFAFVRISPSPMLRTTATPESARPTTTPPSPSQTTSRRGRQPRIYDWIRIHRKSEICLQFHKRIWRRWRCRAPFAGIQKVGNPMLISRHL